MVLVAHFTTTKVVYYHASTKTVVQNRLWRQCDDIIVIKVINNEEDFQITVLELWVQEQLFKKPS